MLKQLYSLIYILNIAYQFFLVCCLKDITSKLQFLQTAVPGLYSLCGLITSYCI